MLHLLQHGLPLGNVPLLFFLAFTCVILCLQDIVDAVSLLYKPDLNNTLNGIHYGNPNALQPMMQSRRDRKAMEESSER